MRRINIRELHLDTGGWVRRAAATGAVVITDRGRPVAELRPYAGAGQPLPDREAAIRARGGIEVDSGALISQDRDER
ncbi:MAG: type II toxin-antitoxin system Phd/YefM family antitoxin [Terriglobales bacterium]